METELISSMAEYVNASQAVLASLAEGHYVAGRANRDFVALRKASDKLLATLEKAKAWKIPAAPATPPTPAPAA